jgi:hypothetical protein
MAETSPAAEFIMRATMRPALIVSYRLGSAPRPELTVQTQHLGENEDEDLRSREHLLRTIFRVGTYHADEETRLLRSSTDTSVTNDADGEASRETREADRETCAELDEAVEQRHDREHYGWSGSCRAEYEMSTHSCPR